jgi:hypothetical protein
VFSFFQRKTFKALRVTCEGLVPDVHRVGRAVQILAADCLHEFILGPIFRTFVSAESDFPRKVISMEFLGKTIFQNFFRGKFLFFPTFLWEKFSMEFLSEFYPEKMYKKSAPDLTLD